MQGFEVVRGQQSLLKVTKGRRVVALFFADWCGFCTRFLPSFARLEADGLVKVAVDISDEGNPLWELYEINVVPTLLLFEDGMVVGRRDGRLGIGLSDDELIGLVGDG